MASNRPRILIIGPRGVFGYEGGIEKFTDEFLPRTLKHADATILCVHPYAGETLDGLDFVHVKKSKL